MRELERLQSHARTSRPIHHVHADPPPDLTPEQAAIVLERFWSLYEAEFGLEDAPFYSRTHIKHHRTHQHRVYGLGRTDGSVVSMAFDMPRREKISRTIEVEFDLPLTPGGHNLAVLGALERDGRHEVAAAMREAGLHEIARPRSTLTPRQRAQQDRTGIDRAELAIHVAEAWHGTMDGRSFLAAVTRSGSRVARGRWCPVVVDRTGNVHALLELLDTAARQRGPVAPSSDAVHARLAETTVPNVADAKAALIQPGSATPDTSAHYDEVYDATDTTSASDHLSAGPLSRKAVQSRGDAATARRGTDGTGGERGAGSQEQGRPEPGRLVGVEVGDDRRGAASASHIDGAVGGGDDSVGPNHRTAGDDRGGAGAGRAAAYRDRVEARRVTRGLAEVAARQADRLAKLTRLVAAAPTVETIALERLGRAIEESTALLSMGPHADPASRDVDAVEQGLRTAAIKREREAGCLARAAQDRADAARSHLGIMDRLAAKLGAPTQIAAEVARLDQVAADLVSKLRMEGLVVNRSLNDVRHRAIGICDARNRERASWQAKPHIRLAVRELSLDRLALAAVEGGDQAIAELVAGYSTHASRRALEAEPRISSTRFAFFTKRARVEH